MDPSPCLIGGDEFDTEQVITVCHPWTGEIAWSVSAAGYEDVKRAISLAEIGAQEAATLPAHTRSAILLRLADLIQEHSEEFARIIAIEGGKVYRLATVEVGRSIETIRLSAQEALRIYGEEIPADVTPAGEGRICYTRRVPVGVVLAITPFNFPLNLACHKIGPAVAGGNAVILKPASATPMTAVLLGRLLVQAGYPPEAVSVIPCSPEVAESVVRDPRISMLSFTGSPDVGWHLKSVTHARKVSLELGGNAAVIVHEDADLERATKRIVEGGFSHAGQVCISVQRVYVHRSLYQACVQRILPMISALQTGDPLDERTDLGPVISESAAVRIESWIEKAKQNGAVILTGGSRNGRIIQPTVLTDVTPDMEVCSEEIFGPVITITPYDSFEEAVTMVNDSRYGLQAGVFTNNLRMTLRAIEMIRTGAVIINDIPTFRMDHLPYGGVKHSGVGREGPRYAIEEMTDIRLVIISP